MFSLKGFRARKAYKFISLKDLQVYKLERFTSLNGFRDLVLLSESKLKNVLQTVIV